MYHRSAASSTAKISLPVKYNASTNQAFRDFGTRLIAKLDELHKQYDEVQKQLSAPFAMMKVDSMQQGVAAISGNFYQPPDRTPAVLAVTNQRDKINQKINIIKRALDIASEYNFATVEADMNTRLAVL